MNPANILLLTVFVTMILTVVITSYKTGLIPFSVLSVARKSQPRFKVDNTKIGIFAVATLSIFLLNVFYCFLVLGGVNRDEMEGILIFSVWDTAVISFGLSFWILLEEKE
jgi:hypothetical protein